MGAVAIAMSLQMWGLAARIKREDAIEAEEHMSEEPLSDIQNTFDEAIEDPQLADWFRRASMYGQLVVRRGDEEYILDLSKLQRID